MKLKKDYYVEGFEYYGNKVRKTKGWIDDISVDENNKLVVSIQCDDEWNGYRGNNLYEELGNIDLISKNKSRPIL